VGFILFRKKLAARMGHLIEVFGEIGALDVVSWWTSYGESRGKGGLLTDGFWGLWITQSGELFFCEGLGDSSMRTKSSKLL